MSYQPPDRLAGQPPRKPNTAVLVFVVIVVLLGLGAAIQMAITGKGRDEDRRAERATTSRTTEESTEEATTEATTTTRATTVAPRTTQAAYPDFWLRVDRDGYATANVKETLTDDELRAVFLEIRRSYDIIDKGDGWHLQIKCGSSQRDDSGAVQANGAFALTNLGAAQTGVAVGEYRFEPVANRAPCPPDLPSPAADALTAQRVVDEFRVRGLPVGDARDNTGRSCGDPQCVQLITTDDVSVYQFADAERAEYWANAVFPSHYRNGLIVLRFTEGGGHPTPEWAVPEYRSVLDALVGAN